ncbi:hypothetical protein MPTK1_6g05420 [Marchantia polymorpha subsp. ruderalis]|uniref:Malectin-like domain-containing protein n=2 Tax=Marchantia polymorpha TaxID=3197 RepID=A0AAF6BNS9_MARPO|nr:hypothetical protein MARPO_0167s0024 [Marchantia polymorpha]BBN13663.1 hypothetical protein Mp_6g05420 [Marchantia polymorpha subsp. ruderalis]|eukprot:PTQ28332.1 hypothetical protein MARPO_0167s0024 [Marchantia polymorpha]
MCPDVKCALFCALLLASVAALRADLLVYVDSVGCDENVPVESGIGQSFRLASVSALDKIDILLYNLGSNFSRFSVELRESEGPGGSKLGTSAPAKAVGPSSSSLKQGWYSFSFSEPITLLADRAYTLKLKVPDTILSAGFASCANSYAGGLLYNPPDRPVPNRDLVFRGYGKPLLLAHWPFDKHLNDVSPYSRGPAVVKGSTVSLVKDYISVRAPGYLDLPRLDFRFISFTVTFSLRVPSGTPGRQFMFADWSHGDWQFLAELENSRLGVVLRRNVPQDITLVNLYSTSPIPYDQWFDVAWVFDKPSRTLALYFDGEKVGDCLVEPRVWDLSLKYSPGAYYQSDARAEEATHLNADVRNLRLYATSDLSITRLVQTS